MIFFSILTLIIGTPLAIMMSRSISRPLYLLAQYTERFFAPTGNFNTEFPKIKSTIYEVNQLYQSIEYAFQQIKNHINQLDSEIQTDALTGIANRRTFNLVIKEQIQNGTPFSLIMLDIDFFKKVNDTFGHLKGDDVLIYLARTMQELSREGDLCFRYGGEEFAIIVPYGDAETAAVIAERLRMKLEKYSMPDRRCYYGFIRNISLSGTWARFKRDHFQQRIKLCIDPNQRVGIKQLYIQKITFIL